MNELALKPIGIIHTPFEDPRGAPIQPRRSGGATGTVEVYDEYAAGLSDLDGFSHIVLLYHLHLSRGFKLRVTPYLDNKERGLFATRAPRRPNPIGLSVVELIRIDGNTLHIAGADMIDGTPLLDIKPYVPEFDTPPDFKLGWLEEARKRAHKTNADGRFITGQERNRSK